MGCSSSKEASLEELVAAPSAAKNTATITKEEFNLTQASKTLPGPDPEQGSAALPGPDPEQDEARVAVNPVAQANKGTTASVQNRLTLGAEFAECASIGNPSMSRKNAVVISAADLEAWGRMPLFEECAERGQHVPIEDLAATDKVAFISHRWQDAATNLADDAACSQYQVIMAYLLGSEEGQSVTYVWLDLACINQDRSRPESLKEFYVKLDNIGTAIACSHAVLVVPRLIEQQQAGGYLSDLKEYMERGWCLYEIISAIEMRCRIRVALVCGPPAEARFELMQPGPAPGEELTLAKLVEEGNAQRQSTNNDGDRASNSLRAAVGRALEDLRSLGAAPPAAAAAAAAGALLLDRAAECWGGAEDPAALLRKMHEVLDADLYEEYSRGYTRSTVDKQQRTAATLTVDLNPQDSWAQRDPQAGKVIAALLPRFTKEEDREVVVRLLVCLLVLARTAFAAVAPRDPEALRALAVKDLGHWAGPALDLEDKALLPCEVAPLLEALMAELARREAAGEGLAGRPLGLNLRNNPIGPQGVKALREAAPRLPPLSGLNLTWCGLGAGGALELAELLAAPLEEGGGGEGATVGAHLERLRLGGNGLGEAGGRALAGALASVPELKELRLVGNDLGESGGRAVAAALASVPKLKQLYLGGTGLGEAGGRAVAAALASVPELNELYLGANGLGEAGGQAVAGALASVPKLERLGLHGNGLGEAGGRAVAGALASVPKLEWLDLEGNHLGLEAGAAVRAAWAAPLPDGSPPPRNTLKL